MSCLYYHPCNSNNKLILRQRDRSSSVHLWNGWPGFDPRQEHRIFFSLYIQTGCTAYPSSCPMGTGDPSPGCGERPKLEADHSPLHVSRLRTIRVIPPLPTSVSMACSGTAVIYVTSSNILFVTVICVRWWLWTNYVSPRVFWRHLSNSDLSRPTWSAFSLTCPLFHIEYLFVCVKVKQSHKFHIRFRADKTKDARVMCNKVLNATLLRPST